MSNGVAMEEMNQKKIKGREGEPKGLLKM